MKEVTSACAGDLPVPLLTSHTNTLNPLHGFLEPFRIDVVGGDTDERGGEEVLLSEQKIFPLCSDLTGFNPQLKLSKTFTSNFPPLQMAGAFLGSKALVTFPLFFFPFLMPAHVSGGEDPATGYGF